MADDANPRIFEGANNPPPEAPDPIAAHTVNIDDLYLEASNWCDGADIENEEQAAVVERLISDFKDAIAACEVTQDEMIKPHADKVTAVRVAFYPLIGDTKAITGKAIRAKKALLAVKSVWANKLEAKRKEEAEELRKKAVAEANAAAQAIRDAQGDLSATEDAEDLIKAAQQSLKAAAQAEKPSVRGMRDNWVVKGFAPVTDEDGKVTPGEVVMLRHYFKTRASDLVALCLEMARADVRAGKRSIPGVIIENERRAV